MHWVLRQEPLSSMQRTEPELETIEKQDDTPVYHDEQMEAWDAEEQAECKRTIVKHDGVRNVIVYFRNIYCT
jgi:hypothetical protein